MSSAAGLRSTVRARPLATTAVLSALGYLLVVGTFAGWVNVYPDLSVDTVNLLTHLVAVINTLALGSLVAGVYFIRQRQIRRHATAMLLAFALILCFLVVYLLRVGGGFEKAIVAPDLVTAVYLLMLAIHILLSIVAVPVVLYAVILGLTRTPAELAESSKASVGRLAAGAWILSLFLGIVTYLLLNHAYESEPRHALFLLGMACPAPVRLRLLAWLRSTVDRIRHATTRIRDATSRIRHATTRIRHATNGRIP